MGLPYMLLKRGGLKETGAKTETDTMRTLHLF